MADARQNKLDVNPKSAQRLLHFQQKQMANAVDRANRSSSKNHHKVVKRKKLERRDKAQQNALRFRDGRRHS